MGTRQGEGKRRLVTQRGNLLLAEESAFVNVCDIVESFPQFLNLNKIEHLKILFMSKLCFFLKNINTKIKSVVLYSRQLINM